MPPCRCWHSKPANPPGQTDTALCTRRSHRPDRPARAEKLQHAFGQPFVIDNRGGASGAIGTEAAARSAPDGYTFLLTPGAALCCRCCARWVNYDVGKDFLPVADVGGLACGFVVVPVGGGLLGGIAGEIIIGDDVVRSWVTLDPLMLERIVQPSFTMLVMAIGTILARRAVS